MALEVKLNLGFFYKQSDNFILDFQVNLDAIIISYIKVYSPSQYENKWIQKLLIPDTINFYVAAMK